MAGGLVLGGTLTEKGTVKFTGTQTLSGTGSLVLDSPSTINAYMNIEGMAETPAVLTIGESVSISGKGSRYSKTITTTNASIVNNGTIRNEEGVLNINATIDNKATGTISKTGGTLNFSGVIINTGRIFNYETAINEWNWTSGTIRGGTILVEDCAKLLERGSSFWLEEMHLEGDLAVKSTLNVRNGLDFNGTLTVSGTIIFQGSQSLLGGTGTIVLNGGLIYVPGGTQSAPVTLTLGADVTVRGYWTFGYDSYATIVNKGTIVSDVKNNYLYVHYGNTETSAFLNEGVVRVENGGYLTVNRLTGNVGDMRIVGEDSQLQISGTDYVVDQGLTVSGKGTLSLRGTFTNASTITATNATLLELGYDKTKDAWTNTGSVVSTASTLNLGGNNLTYATLGTINRTDGTVRLTGTWTDTHLTLNATTGDWELYGGTIKDGTISTLNGTELLVTYGGTLDGVRLDGTMRHTYYSLNIYNGIEVNGTWTDTSGYSSYVYFRGGSQTISGTGEIVMAGGYFYIYDGTQDNPVTLTIGKSITVRGRGSWGHYSNASLVNAGTIAPTGNMTINCDFVLAESGYLEFEIGGNNKSSQYDTISIYGKATLNGTVQLFRKNYFTPSKDVSFEVLTFSSRTEDTPSYAGLKFSNVAELYPDLTPTTLIFTVGFSSGARVVALNPGDNSPKSGSSPFFDVVFNQTMNSSTFTTGDLVVVDPKGKTISAKSVVSLNNANDTFRVYLNQEDYLEGTYRVTVGPDVRNRLGNLMNQNNNQINGEASDIFVGDVTLHFPDLAISIPNDFPPLTTELGMPFDVSWVVTNKGQVSVLGTWTDKIYLSRENRLTSDSLLLSEVVMGSDSLRKCRYPARRSALLMENRLLMFPSASMSRIAASRESFPRSPTRTATGKPILFRWNPKRGPIRSVPRIPAHRVPRSRTISR